MMKRYIRTTLLLAAFVISISLIPPVSVDALQSRTENFSRNYTLTGNGGTDMVAIAMAQLGKTGKQMGYSEEWCCDFLCDCAILAGQADAVPAYAACTGLYNKIIAAGGKKTTASPQPGDICFINWDGGSHKQHVELVYKVEDGYVYTIGGNTGSGSSLYKRTVSLHDPLAKRFIVTIVRPAYKVIDTSYSNQCDTYTTSGTVTVVTSSKLMSQPCYADTDGNSVAMACADVGSRWHVKKLYRNPLGQLWYQVSFNGEKAYLNAADTTFAQQEDCISAEGLKYPTGLEKGDTFPLSGKITSESLPLCRVWSEIQRDGEAFCTATTDPNSMSFSLRGSMIDSAMTFGELDAGTYRLVISASVQGYYADSDGRTLRTFEQEKQLLCQPFTVTEHVCQWTKRYYASEHPHYAIYRCSGCGATKTDLADTVTEEDCNVCFPPPPKVPELPEQAIERMCDQCCIHPFFLSCLNCRPSEN